MPFHKKVLREAKSGVRRSRRLAARTVKRGSRSVKRSVRSFTKSKSVRDVGKLARRANPVRGFRQVTRTLKDPRRSTRGARARRQPRRR